MCGGSIRTLRCSCGQYLLPSNFNIASVSVAFWGYVFEARVLNYVDARGCNLKIRGLASDSKEPWKCRGLIPRFNFLQESDFVNELTKAIQEKKVSLHLVPSVRNFTAVDSILYTRNEVLTFIQCTVGKKEHPINVEGLTRLRSWLKTGTPLEPLRPSKEDEKKDLRGLLSSILFQLCDQSDSYYTILSSFYSTHRNGVQSPSNDELIQCLKDLLGLPGQAPIYLIIDALDECPNTSLLSRRDQVLLLLEDLLDSKLPNLRICVTSRPETDIKPILEPLTFRSVSLHDDSGQKEDIENYIKSIVNMDRRMRKWTSVHKQLVIDVVTERADGM